jgi:hypothetical protein
MISNGSIKPAKIFFILSQFKFKILFQKPSIKVINIIETNECPEFGVTKLLKILMKKVRNHQLADFLAQKIAF